VDALASDLVAVQSADGADGLLHRHHLDGGLELVVCVGAQLHTFHLDHTHDTKPQLTINKKQEQGLHV